MATTITGEFKRALKATVVDTLPEQGISNKLYFVLNGGSSEDNRYDEYIWVIDSEHPEGTWEKVGYRYVDLTQYYTKEQVDNIANNKIDKGTLKTINGESIEGTGDIKIGVTNLDPVQSLAYGVEWDINNSSPYLTRIGNLELHRTLPIQSALRGCVCQGKKIMYYLDPDDWSKKKDGTASRLDGYDGTVEVETPEFYLWSEVDGDKRRVWISFSKLSPYAIRIPRMLVGAYKATVLNTVPEGMGYLSTLPVNSAISVMNDAEYCRGGGLETTYDHYNDPFRTTLQKPRTNINRGTFRPWARNAGKEILCYEYYKAIFYWLYVIEYANFHSQDAYNPVLTSEGFRQGGLNYGITGFDNVNMFNSFYPIIPCGYGNSIGNNTGIIHIDSYNYMSTLTSLNIISWTVLASSVTKNTSEQSLTIIKAVENTNLINTTFEKAYGTYTFNVQGLEEGQTIIIMEDNTIISTIDSNGDHEVIFSKLSGSRYIRTQFSGDCNITIITPVVPEPQDAEFTSPALDMPRWRGFDNPFGDSFTILDGIIINNDSSNVYVSSVYTTTNPENFGDTAEYKNKMKLAGYQTNTSGYISDFNLGETAEIIPSSVLGGESTTYMCDYNYSTLGTNLRILFQGGGAGTSARAGLACFYSYYGVGTALRFAGFRLAEVIN